MDFKIIPVKPLWENRWGCRGPLTLQSINAVTQIGRAAANNPEMHIEFRCHVGPGMERELAQKHSEELAKRVAAYLRHVDALSENAEILALGNSDLVALTEETEQRSRRSMKEYNQDPDNYIEVFTYEEVFRYELQFNPSRTVEKCLLQRGDFMVRVFNKGGKELACVTKYANTNSGPKLLLNSSGWFVFFEVGGDDYVLSGDRRDYSVNSYSVYLSTDLKDLPRD